MKIDVNNIKKKVPTVTVDRADFAQNSRKEVLVCIESPIKRNFSNPVLQYKVSDAFFDSRIIDKDSSESSPVRLPTIKNVHLQKFMSEIPSFSLTNDPKPDGRIEGKKYVLVSEVVGDKVENTYYALIEDVTKNPSF